MWILLLFHMSGYGPKTVISMQEFNSKESCLYAAKTIIDTCTKTPYCHDVQKTICIPK